MSKIIHHHGIWTHGNLSTDLLAADLARLGYEVLNPEHKTFSNVLNASKMARQFARVVIRDYRPGDHFIGHSHGCLVGLEAMRMGARFGTVIFTGAAVDAGVTFPHHGAAKIINIYNPFDQALPLGDAIPWSQLGALGQTGYSGPPDDRVTDLCWKSYDGRWNHTMPYFSDKNRPRLVKLVVETIPLVLPARASKTA